MDRKKNLYFGDNKKEAFLCNPKDEKKEMNRAYKRIKESIKKLEGKTKEKTNNLKDFLQKKLKNSENKELDFKLADVLFSQTNNVDLAYFPTIDIVIFILFYFSFFIYFIFILFLFYFYFFSFFTLFLFLD